jgi:hypothetical protein
MSRRVYVRIVRDGGKFVVVGRKTSLEFDTFREAWRASIPYFLGDKE